MVSFIFSSLVKLGCAMVGSVFKAMLVPVSAGMLSVLSVSEESGTTVEGRHFFLQFISGIYIFSKKVLFFNPSSCKLILLPDGYVFYFYF